MTPSFSVGLGERLEPLTFDEWLATLSEDQQENVKSLLSKLSEEDRKKWTEWTCPECGSIASGFKSEVSSTYKKVLNPEDNSSHYLLAHGIDPGPGKVEERPLTYDRSFVCVEGHEIYDRTVAVRDA